MATPQGHLFQAGDPPPDPSPAPEDKKHKHPKEIEIIGEIGWEVDGAEIRKQIKAVGEDTPIQVNLHSQGGSIFDGYLIHNSLVEHPAPVTVNIIGLAASAGSWIPLAADPGGISMHNLGQMMIHRGRMGVFDTADGIETALNLLRSLDSQMAALYSKRTGIDQEEVLEMMDREAWMTTEEAIEAGFVDSSIDGPVPEARLDLSHLGTVPESVSMAFGPLPKKATPPDPIAALLVGVESLPPEKVHATDPGLLALAGEALLKHSQGVTL